MQYYALTGNTTVALVNSTRQALHVQVASLLAQVGAANASRKQTVYQLFVVAVLLVCMENRRVNRPHQAAFCTRGYSSPKSKV